MPRVPVDQRRQEVNAECADTRHDQRADRRFQELVHEAHEAMSACELRRDLDETVDCQCDRGDNHVRGKNGIDPALASIKDNKARDGQRTRK